METMAAVLWSAYLYASADSCEHRVESECYHTIGTFVDAPDQGAASHRKRAARRRYNCREQHQ
jgi:hypothetical protein